MQNVRNSNWNNKMTNLSDWFKQITLKQVFAVIKTIVGGFFTLLLVTSCCIIPVVQLMIKKATAAVSGQFPLEVEKHQMIAC